MSHLLKDAPTWTLCLDLQSGVKPQEYQLIDQLAQENLIPDYIVDIAHGHLDTVIDMIKYIRQNSLGPFVIAGNVGTPEGVRELENAGAWPYQKSGSDRVKPASLKSRLALGLAVGN